MPRPDNWRDLPVWVMSPDEFESGYWVDASHQDPEDPPSDPEDLGQRVVYAGFTWGEAVDAENKFLCAIRIHHSIPVPQVVLLSTLPQEMWMGLPVFHPMSQRGEVANWHAYDVGVVIDVYPDPDFAEYGEWKVRFQGGVGSGGWTLAYSPTNLWVPKVHRGTYPSRSVMSLHRTPCFRSSAACRLRSRAESRWGETGIGQGKPCRTACFLAARTVWGTWE